MYIEFRLITIIPFYTLVSVSYHLMVRIHWNRKSTYVLLHMYFIYAP